MVFVSNNNNHEDAVMEHLKAESSNCGLMMCVNIYNPTKEEREKIHDIMRENRIGTKAYELSRNAGAFLQCDGDSYMLIEFWNKNYQPFVAYLNEELNKT